MASRKYGYVLTEIAEADIDDTFEYIAEELSNPDAASGFADELEKKIDEICNYICYYIVDDEERNIVILRLVYGKRDQCKILKSIS